MFKRLIISQRYACISTVCATCTNRYVLCSIFHSEPVSYNIVHYNLNKYKRKYKLSIFNVVATFNNYCWPEWS